MQSFTCEMKGLVRHSDFWCYVTCFYEGPYIYRIEDEWGFEHYWPDIGSINQDIAEKHLVQNLAADEQLKERYA